MNARGSGEARARGSEGEARAAAFLESLGCVVLDRGWRTPRGELDLVVRDGDTVVFVEVKARGESPWGLPEEAVDARKQRRMARAAAAYLQRARLTSCPVRFDVVALDGERLRHIPDAFQASGYTL